MTERRTRPRNAYIGREDDFQISAMRLVRIILVNHGYDERLAYHVPNGGKRSIREAARFKAMGVQRGVPDIAIDIREPIGTLHGRSPRTGLNIELKTWPNKPTEDQLEMHELLREQGRKVVVCYSLDEVEHEALLYLRGEGLEIMNRGIDM